MRNKFPIAKTKNKHRKLNVYKRKFPKCKMPKIKVDQEKCIGCGLCAEICPKSFEMKGDKAKEKVSNVKTITKEKEAAESCAVQAIYIS